MVGRKDIEYVNRTVLTEHHLHMKGPVRVKMHILMYCFLSPGDQNDKSVHQIQLLFKRQGNKAEWN